MREWNPSKRQEEFISLPDSIREALYGGAAGGGKSEILLLLPIVRQFYTAPRWKGLLLRRTYPELEKSLILRSQEWYPSTGAEYNRQLRRWKWPSGAVLDFGYAENENDVRRYDTTEYNYIGWDELTSFTEFQYMYLSMSRCRTSDANLPAFVRGATNPGNVGHGWVRKRFVEPAPYGTIVKDKRTGHKRIFIQSLLKDNPYLMKADPEYARSLEMLPEAEKRAKLYGDWWTFSGQVFDDWRVAPFPDEPDNAKHVIEPFEVPLYWPRVLAIDWGFSAMTWAGWFAVSPQGRVYLYREYTCTKTKISTWASDIARLSQYEKLDDIVLDPSAWASSGVDHTVAEQFMQYSGLTPRKADNDRLGGKVLMQEYIRWVPKPAREMPPEGFNPDFAQWLLRIKGMEAYNAYVNSFQPEPQETNLPKLQVFNTCTEFIRAIPLCVYNSDTTNNIKIEDVAEFVGDDPYDGGRYGLKAADRLIKMSERRIQGIAEREAIVQELNDTGDQTRFYRKMEYFEQRNKKRRAQRRFHGPFVQTPF